MTTRSIRRRALNEGRDSRPGNGRSSTSTGGTCCALNEGRDSRPGNGPQLARRQPALPALNEGRDSRPGNGRTSGGSPSGPNGNAQRGPGLASRQRVVVGALMAMFVLRSTRAGTRVPATVWFCRRCSCPVHGAQRGPGLASRQRGRRGRAAAHRPGVRSTRAGTRVPATGDRAVPRRPPGPGRSTRAGTRVPATGCVVRMNAGVSRAQRGPGLASRQRLQPSRRSHRAPRPALNEGRDSRPGNGWCSSAVVQ